MNGSIILILLPVLLVILLFNSQRKRARQTSALQSELTPGATICTTSGLFGTVISMTDAEILLEAAPGVQLRFDRRAVALVIPPAEPEDAADPEAPAASDGPDEPPGTPTVT